MVGLMRGIFNGSKDVLALQIRIISQNLLVGGTRAQEFEHVGHAHPHAPDARTSTAFARFDGDALEQFFLHDDKLPLTGGGGKRLCITPAR